MDTSTLEAFLLLSRLGHMTRTAAELHLTQPAVSARIQRLEEEVGHRLFDRTPKGMVLTPAGELYQTHAREALARLEAGARALRQMSGLERGALAIGGGATATTYLLPPLLGRFHAAHPGIQLFVQEQGSGQVVASVLEESLDLGVVTLPVEPALVDRLEIEPWVDDELCLIVKAGHPLSGAGTFDWSELDDVPLVLFEAGTAVRAILDRCLLEASVRTKIVMELRSIESIKQMVAQGIGAAFVSQFALSGADLGLRPRSGGVRRELAIVTRKGRTLPHAAQTFLDMMRALDR